MGSCAESAAPAPVEPILSQVQALCIAGPTACGKTALALQIAEQWPVEIISVDSALVYRGMNIGTAKPSAAELAAAPHHLIDIIEPTQSYSAAQFARDAQSLIAQIRSRGRLPLLVGGTMLYFKALLQGLDDMPAANPLIRAEIDLEAKRLGWPALHSQLAQIDPLSAARLAPHDGQRIQRALEVFRSSGQPLSSFQRQKLPFSMPKSSFFSVETAGTAPENIASRIPLISLEPTSRAWLHERIAQRLDAMLAAGLIAEVEQLKARGDLNLELPSMRCVGYRQTWEMLDGHYPESELRERAIAATRQLAKRQITWLRSMQAPPFEKHILPPDGVDHAGTAIEKIANILNAQMP